MGVKHIGAKWAMEIGIIHGGNLKVAMNLIRAASRTGVDAVKLQTFKPELMTLDSDKKRFIVNHKNSKWSKKTLFSLYKKSYTPWEWYYSLKKYCKKKKIILFSSVFDLKSLDFPLNRFIAKLEEAKHQLKNGLGFVLLRNLPVNQFSDKNIKQKSS